MSDIVKQRDGRWGKEDISSLIHSVSSPGDELTVVEVGAYAGETTKLMLDTGRVGKIYCIDIWVGGYDESDKRSSSDYAAAESAFDALFSGDARVVKFKGTLDEFVKAHSSDISNASADLVYIDSCRLYDSVLSAIRLSVEHIRPKRALAGYAYTEPSVRSAVIDTLGRPSYFLFGSWVHVFDRSYTYRKVTRLASTGTKFDIASVLLFSGGDDGYCGREEAVIGELDSAGIKAEPFRHVGTAYDGLIERTVSRKTKCSGGTLNSTLGHLAMIRSAYNRGANTAIFFEDDVRFLKDRTLLSRVMASVPSNFDIALFDWNYPDSVKPQDRSPVPGRKVNECWSTFSDLRGASAYALSRAAMLRMIVLLERAATGAGVLKPVDEFYWDVLRARDMNAYAAIPNACIRGLPGNSKYGALLENYASFGISYDNYDYVKPQYQVLHNVVGPQPTIQPESSVDCHSDDEPVDAVFVIGTGSKNNNEELKYALRNVERNCPFVRNVYISGECPDWINRDVVIHLKWPDRFHHAKDANITDKIRHACEDPRIARRVLFCSDDQFQTRVCAWEDFAPVWLREYKRDDTWYADRKRVWHTRLWKTLERDRLRRIRCGLDPNKVYYWEPHIYSPVDRDLFLQFARWADYEHVDGMITQSAYYNFIGQTGSRSADHTFAGKNMKFDNPKTHIAYNDDSFDVVMGYLHRTFPNKSRFEL